MTKKVLLYSSGILAALSLLLVFFGLVLPTFSITSIGNVENIYLFEYESTFLIYFSQLGALVSLVCSCYFLLIKANEKKGLLPLLLSVIFLGIIVFYIARMRAEAVESISTLQTKIGYAFIITAIFLLMLSVLFSIITLFFTDKSENVSEEENEFIKEIESYYDLLNKKIISEFEYEVKRKTVIRNAAKDTKTNNDLKQLVKWKELQTKGLITEEEFLQIKKHFDVV